MGFADYLMFGFVLLLSTGCFYDPDRSKIDEDGQDTGGTGWPTVASDAGTDAGDGGGTSKAGLGEECFVDGDCGGNGTNYCAKMVADANSPGSCTIKDCVPDACPDGYLWCHR